MAATFGTAILLPTVRWSAVFDDGYVDLGSLNTITDCPNSDSAERSDFAIEYRPFGSMLWRGAATERDVYKPSHTPKAPEARLSLAQALAEPSINAQALPAKAQLASARAIPCEV